MQTHGSQADDLGAVQAAPRGALSILQEIQKWSTGLPAWQQHAIAKLYAQEPLAGPALDHVYALLKAEHGIPDPEGRAGDALGEDQVAAPADAHVDVRLVAMKDMFNVNALAEGQRLPVGAQGLTVIYGENGAGKSGYSRVLKKACRARDQREAILPDAKKPKGAAAPAKASFELTVDGAAIDVEWIDKTPAPQELASFAIFDAHCARAYVDNQGDFAYAPYGLDILEGLVKACDALKDLATKESFATRPNVDAFAALAKTPTEAGKLLAGLSAGASREKLQSLATLSPDEASKLEALRKTLAEADPKQKAQGLRSQATRFGSLANRIAEASAVVDQAKIDGLKALVEKSNVAKRAAALAAKAFNETPGLLPGTGSEEWKALFEMARGFAATSHPAKDLAHLGPADACPLCQNALGADGAARMLAFDTHVRQQAEKDARAARDAAKAAFVAIRDANVGLGVDEAMAADLEALDPGLAKATQDLYASLAARKAAIEKAAAAAIEWTAIPALSASPSAALLAARDDLNQRAKALEDAMDPQAKAAMAAAFAELDARRALGELKALALDAIARFEHMSKLAKCALATGTFAISKKSSDLAKTMATPEVAKALNDELKRLNVHELSVVMKNQAPKGKAQFKLTLELPGGGSPADILSEGEQRSIALGSFLAEVNLGKGKGGIVFDDPVSSLDHRRRWHVAKRLAEEAKTRQVIVFTHDIYFLCILQQEAEAAGSEIATQCIRKAPAGFGVQSDKLPFDAMSTGKRIGALKQMHAVTDKAHRDGDDELAKTLSQNSYYHLRLAWERAVEEILLNETLTRFNEGVSTKRLKSVVVEDADYAAIDAGMTKSSKFAHDPAAAAQLPTPHPDELADDIKALDTWRAAVESRRKATAAARA